MLPDRTQQLILAGRVLGLTTPGKLRLRGFAGQAPANCVLQVGLFGPKHEIARIRASRAPHCWTYVRTATGGDETAAGRGVATAQAAAGIQV